jgi:hypothetical protein
MSRRSEKHGIMRMQRGIGASLACFLAWTLAVAPAHADAPAQGDTSNASATEPPPPVDPTGGAYTTPTLLFIPAGAVPAWNVRAIVSTDVQSPADVHATVRPGVGVV